MKIPDEKLTIKLSLDERAMLESVLQTHICVLETTLAVDGISSQYILDKFPARIEVAKNLHDRIYNGKGDE